MAASRTIDSREYLRHLVCPTSHQALSLTTATEAGDKIGRRLCVRTAARNARGMLSHPVGVTNDVLLRADLKCAYPVVDGYPILLAPEALYPEGESRTVDLTDPVYAEAYEEMDVYNEVATQEAKEIQRSEAFAIIQPILARASDGAVDFPEPAEVWLDAVYDCAGQLDAYQHLAPVRHMRVLQLGGKGIHAVKLLLAGASDASLVTPMLGEARCATALANIAGVGDRLHCIVAVAEQLPLSDNAVDRIYSGGCLHHMTTSLAFAEANRVLTPGGRFAAVDPWKAPLYSIGIRVFGKREQNVYCVPLDPSRVAPGAKVFQEFKVVHHGAITRYPLLALQKLGMATTLRLSRAITRMDDALSDLLPTLRASGSSVVLLGTK
jgi:uncharacterized protein YbaR (Trm112 family)